MNLPVMPYYAGFCANVSYSFLYEVYKIKA